MGKIGRNLSKLLSKHSGQANAMYDIKPKSLAVETVNIDEFMPNSAQPRTDFNDAKLEDLSRSIKEQGVIQPIIYRITPKGKEIIAGERRWRAAKMAKLDRIPAIEKDVSDEEALELAMVENIQREDLNPLEKAEGFKALIDKHRMTQQDIGERLGINRATIANFMRLLQLPDEIKKYVSRETISMGHARCLLSVTDKKKQMHLAKRIINEGLSVREIEHIVYESPEESSVVLKIKQKKKDPYILDLEKQFRKVLGTKVTIKNTKNNKGKIIVEYYSNDDFSRIAEKLGIDL